MFALPSCLRWPLLTVGCALMMTGLGYAGEGDEAQAVDEAADSLGWTLYAGYESKYLFRGVDYGDHLLEVGMSIPVTLGDAWTLTFEPWYGELAGGDYPELDLVGSLAWDTGWGTLALCVAWYDLPGRSWSTLEPALEYEVEAGMIGSVPLLWFASAGLDVYADGGSSRPRRFGDPGWYFESGLSSTWKVSNKLSLTPEVVCSYGDAFYGVSGWNAVMVKVTATYALTRAVSLTPFVAASAALSGLRQTGETNHLAGGVMMNVEF